MDLPQAMTSVPPPDAGLPGGLRDDKGGPGVLGGFISHQRKGMRARTRVCCWPGQLPTLVWRCLSHCPQRVWWLAWDRGLPGTPQGSQQPGLRNIHLSKPLCLTFHIVEAGLPWSRVCLYIYVYVYTHCMCLLVMAACARERCSLCLAGDGAVGQSVWDSVPCRREMACPWGPWPLRPPGSSLREPPARRKG